MHSPIKAPTGCPKKNWPQGWYLGIKAGHNGWSHGHNDAGSAIVFYNEQPVLIDVGREAYRKQSFGKDRYANWIMQSAYHNLPLINGQQQQDGKAFGTSQTSFLQQRGLTRLRTNLAGAYPPAAGVQRWLRSYSLHA
ncbi:MAG: heparinase II/III-family protein, partial [Chitinophagaceae bacterium]|nr:heparinase II/III-family protein [Chitinophagaceae bacterium]